MFSVVGNLFLLEGITFISAAHRVEDDARESIFCVYIGYMGEEKPVIFDATSKISMREIEAVRRAFIEKYTHPDIVKINKDEIERMVKIVFND